MLYQFGKVQAERGNKQMEKRSNQSFSCNISMEEKIQSNSVDLNISDNVPDYSEQEAKSLESKILNSKTFRKALQILIVWLDNGECVESNSAHFCYLIHICLDYLKKVQSVRKKQLEEAISGIEELFNVIEKPDIWSNFTQSQKENMLKIKINILDLKDKILMDASVNEKEKVLLQTKVGSLTHELNTANQVIEEKEKERKVKEKEILKLRSQLENKESLLVSLLSVFLCKHQNGVSIDTICSIINSSSIIPSVSEREIEDILKRYPKIFNQILEEEIVAVEALQPKKWRCVSFLQETLRELQESISLV